MRLLLSCLQCQLADDALLTKKDNRDVLESLRERIQSVHRFMELIKPSLVYDIVPLHDVYGPTATDPNIQALVVSKETESGGKAGKCSMTVACIVRICVHVYSCPSGQMPGGEGPATIKNAGDRGDITSFASVGSRRRRGAETGQNEQYIYSAVDCFTAKKRGMICRVRRAVCNVFRFRDEPVFADSELHSCDFYLSS
jgi:hypothetical protein